MWGENRRAGLSGQMGLERCSIRLRDIDFVLRTRGVGNGRVLSRGRTKSGFTRSLLTLGISKAGRAMKRLLQWSRGRVCAELRLQGCREEGGIGGSL